MPHQTGLEPEVEAELAFANLQTDLYGMEVVEVAAVVVVRAILAGQGERAGLALVRTQQHTIVYP